MNLQKLEDIVALKAEYGIGTQDAWRYLKVIEDYTALRDRVSEQLHQKGIKTKPSVREISNLCDFIQSSLHEALQIAGAERNLASNTQCCPAMVFPYSEVLNIHFDQDLFYRRKETNTFDFHFDYETFLLSFYEEKQNEELEEAFKATMVEVLAGDVPYFTDPEGNKLTFSAIRGNSKYFGDMGSPLDKETKKSNKFAIRLFYAWLRGEAEERYLTIPDLTQPTEEEKTFLFQKFHSGKTETLYERAKRERTLYRLETERRIALNDIIEYTHEVDGTANDKVQTEIQRLKDLLPCYQRKLRELSEVPIELTPTFRAMWQRKHEETKYTLCAIKKNKAWLEKVLSN